LANAGDLPRAVPSPKPGAAPPTIVDDAPAPFVAEHAQTEAERDHEQALVLFAAGRMHERREELAQALRYYERAWRCDPQASTIVQSILPLAARLKHYSEAVRYALKPVDLDNVNPLLLRSLGVYLTEEGDLADAARLYEKALTARGHGKETAADVVLRMELGRIYHLAGNYKAAAEHFAKVSYALDHPDEFAIEEQAKRILLSEASDTFALFGQCFLSADRASDALAAFQKANAFNADPTLLKFHVAQVDAKTGKPAQALAALESCLPAGFKQEGTAAYETLAAALKQLGRSAELIPRLERLRAADGNNVPLAYFLAGQYRAAGELEKAEQLYLELVKRAATATAYRNLIDLYGQAKRYDALLAILGQAIDQLGVLDELAAESQSVSAKADLMRGLVETARAKYKANPEQFTSGARQAVALLALEAKQYAVAEEFFKLALATKPKQTAELLLAWGVGLLMDDHAAEAARVFQRGIDEKTTLPADSPAFYFYLSGALALSKRTEEALVAARKAAELKKDSARFCQRVAWVLYFAKRYAEAKRAYEELVRDFDGASASPETRDVLRETRFVLSNLCVLENRFPEAEEWLEQVLDEFPDDVGALNDLGYLWADENKNLARAQRMIQRAVDAEPANVAYRDSLGWVLFRLGRYPAAVAELEKAVVGKTIDGVVLDHLGDAYQKANQPAKASAAWQRAAATLRGEREFEKAKSVEKKLHK
jgi:tetratricopeptide (TPR) repeat protein